MDKYEIKARRVWLMLLYSVVVSYVVLLVLYIGVFPLFNVFSQEASLLVSFLVAAVVFIQNYANTLGKLQKGLLATVSTAGVQFYNKEGYFLPWEDIQEVYFKSYVRASFVPERSPFPGLPAIHFLPKPGLESKYGIGSYNNTRVGYLVPSTALDLRLVRESRQELEDLVRKYSGNRFQVGNKQKHYL